MYSALTDVHSVSVSVVLVWFNLQRISALNVGSWDAR